jgi:hypothetical protein
MKKKAIDSMSGQLSRTQMKEIAAGKFPQPPQCACGCPEGPVNGVEMGGTCFCTTGGGAIYTPC